MSTEDIEKFFSIDEEGILKLMDIGVPFNIEIFLDADNTGYWSDFSTPFFKIEIHLPPVVDPAYIVPVDTSPKFSEKPKMDAVQLENL